MHVGQPEGTPCDFPYNEPSGTIVSPRHQQKGKCNDHYSYGHLRQGKIELLETPSGLREGPVRVVLIEADPSPSPARYLTFGKYKGGCQSTLEDFKDAEWHGEGEFDDLHGK